MKLGITTNIFAGPLKTHETDLEGILALASELGVRAVEIRDELATLQGPMVSHLASLAASSGLALSYAIKNDMLAPGDRALFERAVRLASLCGENSVLRVLASQDALKPEGKRGYSSEDIASLETIAEGYGEVASAVGVLVAIENARDPLYGSDGFFGLAELMRRVKSKNVGLTFDPANATNKTLCKSPSAEADVLRYAGELGQRIFLTHYKTTRNGVVQDSIGDADVDNASLLSTLSRVYNGLLCIEIPGAPGLKETSSSIRASISYLSANGLTRYLS